MDICPDNISKTIQKPGQTYLRNDQVTVIQRHGLDLHQDLIVAHLRNLRGFLEFERIEAILGVFNDPLAHSLGDGHVDGVSHKVQTIHDRASRVSYLGGAAVHGEDHFIPISNHCLLTS